MFVLWCGSSQEVDPQAVMMGSVFDQSSYPWKSSIQTVQNILKLTFAMFCDTLNIVLVSRIYITMITNVLWNSALFLTV